MTEGKKRGISLLIAEKKEEREQKILPGEQMVSRRDGEREGLN